MELAAGADIIVVGENSRFGLPEIKLGAIPGSGGTVRITRRIGIGRVSELMLLGDMIDAQQVLAWGYANHIAPKGEVLGARARICCEGLQKVRSRPSVPKAGLTLWHVLARGAGDCEIA